MPFLTLMLVSSLLSKREDSPTVLLLDYVFEGRIVLLFNDEIINEYEDVLRRRQLGVRGREEKHKSLLTD